MRIIPLLSVLLTVSVVTASPVVSAKKAEDSAQGAFGSNQRQERNSEENNRKEYENSVRHKTFSHEEQYKIRNFYKQHEQHEPGDKGKNHQKNAQKDKQKSLPQGLEKKLQRGGDLPPGWEKKIVPGDRLDRDIYRQSERLPDDLDRAIGRVAGEENRRIGNKVIRVLEGDATVIDVIDILDASGVME